MAASYLESIKLPYKKNPTKTYQP